MRQCLVLIVVAILCGPATADPVAVDAELVLLVDASRSIGPEELLTQRQGYAAALESDEVTGAIVSGGIGAISLTYIEWGSNHFQRVVLPWTRIDSPAAAHRAALMLEYDFDASLVLLHNVPLHLRQTSISGAIRMAKQEIERNDYEGLRKVIDISGDGPNNDGDSVMIARDAATAAGIVINGLPLMSKSLNSDPEVEHLDQYYSECVIGGPGAFALPARGWRDFPDAVRRKLWLEMANRPEETWRTEGVIGRQGQPVDCLIGEKMRQMRESQQ